MKTLTTLLITGLISTAATAATATTDKPPYPVSLFDYISKERVSTVMSTPVNNIYQIKTHGGQYYYVSDDGKYAFTTLINIVTGVNITERLLDKDKNKKNEKYLKEVKAMDENYYIKYPARGTKKATLNVFTDITCGFCLKLHNNLDYLQDHGVEVKYFPFSFRGDQTPAAKQMRNIWGSEDKKGNIDLAFNRQLKKLKYSKEDYVSKSFVLGKKMGFSGTPSMITNDGKIIVGFGGVRKLLLSMGL